MMTNLWYQLLKQIGVFTVHNILSNWKINPQPIQMYFSSFVLYSRMCVRRNMNE